MYLSETEGLEIERVAPEWSAAVRLDACRMLDILIGVALLVFTLPLALATATAIKIQDGGPALFWQSRIGRRGKIFRCWKFRSMVVDAEARLTATLARDPAARAEWEADQKLRRDPRVTAFGRFIRATSIDELPQILNVLTGDMSLVGPRPIVPEEMRRYGRWLPHYCSVRPGITGLWQVSGRNNVSYRRRVAMDVLFARRRSVGMYLRLLLATPVAVLSCSGSY